MFWYLLKMLNLVLFFMLIQITECYSANTYLSGQGHVCDMEKRIENNCSEIGPNIRSILECAYFCEISNKCSGISVDSGGKCFFHYECPTIVGCTKEYPNHYYFTNFECHNGGYWMPSKMACQCENGWVGPSCQDYPTNCRSLISNGYPDGQHEVLLDVEQNGEKLVEIKCTIFHTGYNHITIFLNNGRTDFNRSWYDYQNGFYNETDNSLFWIGLERWHLISQIGYTILFVLCEIEGQGALYRHYYDFTVGNYSTGYAYMHANHYENKNGNFDNPSNFVGDCFESYQNVPFSTYDHDVDSMADENCASTSGSGWWYTNCNSSCNLLGWGPELWDGREPAQRMRIQNIDINKDNEDKFKLHVFAAYKDT